jgi:hypothetical protein
MDRMTLTLTIKTNDIGPKRVNVRSSLLVANLITTIKDKFNLDGNYELRLKGGNGILPSERALDQAGVTEGSELVCTRVIEASGTVDVIARGVREPFSKSYARVFLHEQRTLSEYDLMWQPAILGRKDLRNPANNRLLAVDLEDVEELPTVSRHHAGITEQNGSFFIESLQDRNPLYLDGAQVRPFIKHPLSAGALIQMGRVWLTFQLIS